MAKKLGGEVINADSMQVYKDLHILTARPYPEEMEGIAHHLYGHVDGGERYSVGHWLRDAEPIIIDILSRQKVPIIVGGTGLYFKALTEGLAVIPNPSEAGQSYARMIYESQGTSGLRQEAFSCDPTATQRVLGDDPQRLLRIIAVAHGTEKILSEWQAKTRPVIPAGYWTGVKLLPDRAVLYERINARFEIMLREGAIAEVKNLLSRKLPKDSPIMRAIGVDLIDALIRGDIPKRAMLERGQQMTRRYAKRQYTWFNNQANSEAWQKKYHNLRLH